MQRQIGRKELHNTHAWCHFTMLWLTVFLWVVLLLYMLLFHWLRASVEPLIMNHFKITDIASYSLLEAKLFIYLLWSCCIVSILAMINDWGKKWRPSDKISSILLVVLMFSTASFAFFYASCDLNCFDGHLSLLSSLVS